MHDSKDPIEELVHLYVDGAFNRRELVARVTRMLGSPAAAVAAVSGLAELEAQGPGACPAGVRVPVDAPDIVARDIEFAGAESPIYAHFAHPRNMQGPQPGLIVIHENRGLVEHIKDVCRRAARAGFVAIAPDLLSRQGGVQAFAEPTQQTAAYNRTTVEQRRSDLISALDYLKFSPLCQFDRIGALGFCAGGANVWELAVYLEELAVAVPFYGTPPAVEVLQRIQAPVLAIYAERDRALTARMAPVLSELLARQKRFGFSVYEGVGHAFVNDTGANYNATAACEAWAQAMTFCNKWLRAPRT
ncbi:MAG: dienelactone hydrolase family protein [Acidobacteria bacterium]|nr:dienelactone hydrolase family protein [Bryobacteraceae bacterium CoA2 C42]